MEQSEAERLLTIACDRVGGPRVIVGSPRHPFAPNPTHDEDVEGEVVTIHYSEISSPAIAYVGGWVFEIREDEFVVLDRPRKPRV